MKILVFGLSGSGKTTLAKALADKLDYYNFNADIIRTNLNDWDFTPEGRHRQLQRMINASNSVENSVCDFICPTNEFRDTFSANFSIWMNTIDSCKYDDTNSVFEVPVECDLIVTDHNYSVDEIVKSINVKRTK